MLKKLSVGALVAFLSIAGVSGNTTKSSSRQDALVELRVGRIFAITDRANTDSLRLMQRVGMRTVRNPDPTVAYPGVVGVIENPALVPGVRP